MLEDAPIECTARMCEQLESDSWNVSVVRRSMHMPPILNKNSAVSVIMKLHCVICFLGIVLVSLWAT